MQWVSDNIELIITLAVLLMGGGFLAWYRFIRVDSRVADASIRETAAKTESQLAITVASLGVELSRINGEMSDLRGKYRELENLFEQLKDQFAVRGQLLAQYKKGYRVLSRQLVDNKLKPEWTPPD